MFREKMALRVPPFILRVLLGITFLWLGLGKVMEFTPVRGQAAADLANLGIIRTEGSRQDEVPENVGLGPGPVVITVRQSHGGYSAEDFPDPVLVRRVHEVTLRVYRAANPGLDSAGNERRALWPAVLGQGDWPAFIGWTTAITEILAGFFLLIGLLTRFWALMLCFIAGGAMWLMELGPSVQDGTSRMALLPGHDVFNTALWEGFMWKFSLLMTALALMLMGPGPASVDRAVFRGSGGDGE